LTVPYSDLLPSQSDNISVQSVANPRQNPDGVVLSQPQQPSQTLTPAAQEGLQGLSQESGGGGGMGSSNDGGRAGSRDANAAEGASYEFLQDPNLRLYRRYEKIDLAVTPLRLQILAQIGRGVGIRRGFIEEAERIAASIDLATAIRLDARYDFSKQMIGNHLLPPVIGELRGVQEHSSDRLLYLTVGAYRILRQARLVLEPPNWRDYLLVQAVEPRTSSSALRPENVDEQAIYDQAMQVGVARGIQEARDTFEDNLSRLESDYGGMERYHELHRRGAVSLPIVKESGRSLRLADSSQRAFAGGPVVRVRVTSRFRATRQTAYK